MEEKKKFTYGKMYERKYDPFDPTLGMMHLDIVHMLDIIDNPQATKANKIKALRLLNEVLPGRQQEANSHNAINIIRPFLMQPPNGLLLNSLCVFNTLINTADIAKAMLPDVPRLAEILNPDNEPPIRFEAAKLLRIIAEFVGPEPPFLSGSVPSWLTTAVSSDDSDPQFLFQAYGLLSKLANKQSIRIPLVDSSNFLKILNNSFSNPQLCNASIILASNIAMDTSHRGKIALINSGILPNISECLKNNDSKIRYGALSLMALLAVPLQGKTSIATNENLPKQIVEIENNDQDEGCRKAAAGVHVIVAELPMAKEILDKYK
ncbi:Phosphoribulokinase / Uridine kinase family protein [Histomonas meleagridis]|uniref:Phosphoribulokinase / Uridine kinase family protein n=1 Tax=Histomonas meleagridis TaxID=135588 RepID=UPI00355A4686|nr:Phosphoribulokinase / Uridine kinase family protein [Histomonas meleagridis]KAH0807021.1 Phosphoribulokinase / Uridine kinase family protein [Histomonas meleagridis]